MTNLNREQVTFFISFNLIYKDMCFESYLIRTNFRATGLTCNFPHHELSNISRVLIFAQGHFTRNFFFIANLFETDEKRS